MSIPLASLGLDITDVLKAFDKVGKAADNVSGKLTAQDKKLKGFKASLLNAYTATAAAILAVGTALSKNALEMGKRYQEATQKFQAGSAKLEAQGGGSTSFGTGISVAAASNLEDITAKVQKNIGEAAAEAARVAKNLTAAAEGGAAELGKSMGSEFLDDIVNVGKKAAEATRDAAKTYYDESVKAWKEAGAFLAENTELGKVAKATAEAAAKAYQESEKALQAIAAKGNEVNELTKEVAAQEDKIAKLQGEGISTGQQQLKIEREMAALAKLRQKLADHEYVKDRQLKNQATEQAGDAKKNTEEMIRQQNIAAQSAAAITLQMQAEIKGQTRLAALTAIRAKYTKEIEAAGKSGNSELVAQLRIQQQLEEDKAKVAEHNMTPRQRREERKVARKFRRDLAKANAQEAEMESRLGRNEGLKIDPSLGGRYRASDPKTTPGSRMDRYQQSKQVPILQNLLQSSQNIEAKIGANR